MLSARAAHSESYFKGGKIHFLQSSHHDLGWHKGSYPGEMRFTLKEIDVVLDMLRKDPKFKFSGEYTIWLHEYLKHRPAERVRELRQRLKEGRLEWGAGCSQPYTSLLTGEQLARQMIVTAVKKSEEGNDIIVRFYETEGKSGSRVRINPDARLSGARHTNLIEEDSGALEHDRDSASLKVGPYSIETVRLKPSLRR